MFMGMLTRIVAITALVAMAGACSGDMRLLDKPPGEKRSFVYGYFDMDDAPTDADWVQIRQYRPKTEYNIWNMRTHEGVFYMEKFVPGAYGVIKFGGGGGMFSSPHAYGIPRQNKSMRLIIKKPGIYYMGAYKYKSVKTGFFEGGKFSIEKVKKPSEKEVLTRIIKFAKGSGWEKKLEAHMRRLK